MLRFVIVFTSMILVTLGAPSPACCPAAPGGLPIVNADQTVIILWDAANHTEHFIRQASFHTDSDSLGFIIPTPTQPELSESGDEAFSILRKVTEPETQYQLPISCGCGASGSVAAAPVEVLDEKRIGDYKAVVLRADTADALAVWLKENGYASTPEIKAWAEPYIVAKWRFTAMRLDIPAERLNASRVTASALHMTFKTDHPLFPYREPDPTADAATARARILRIYLVAEARYSGTLVTARWSGQTAFADKLSSRNAMKLVEALKLPESAAKDDLWLTEFEDHWQYRPAPADLYFAPSANQSSLKRPPTIQYVSNNKPGDALACALGGLCCCLPLLPRLRRRLHR